jgi:hypothetical protein
VMRPASGWGEMTRAGFAEPVATSPDAPRRELPPALELPSAPAPEPVAA